jgi:hypothetical protein
MTARDPAAAALHALGMTAEEQDLWSALASVAGRMLQLPELHPMERHEAAHDFHSSRSVCWHGPACEPPAGPGRTSWDRARKDRHDQLQ